MISSKTHIFWKSAPGTRKTFKKEKDFQRSIGQSVDIKLYKAIDKQKEFTGILKEYSKERIILSIDGTDQEFETKSVASARLSLDF